MPSPGAAWVCRMRCRRWRRCWALPRCSWRSPCGAFKKRADCGRVSAARLMQLHVGDGGTIAAHRDRRILERRRSELAARIAAEAVVLARDADEVAVQLPVLVGVLVGQHGPVAGRDVA